MIPPPGPAGQRILELRGLIVRLQRLIDPGTLCRYFGADLEDLELLAIVEDELKEHHKEDQDGQGHQTADQGER